MRKQEGQMPRLQFILGCVSSALGALLGRKSQASSLSTEDRLRRGAACKHRVLIRILPRRAGIEPSEALRMLAENRGRECHEHLEHAIHRERPDLAGVLIDSFGISADDFCVSAFHPMLEAGNTQSITIQ